MIYVLVPAYNEAATVGLLLWKVRQVFSAFPREYQLLVVNDGSTDGSDAVLAPYARALPLTLITHKERKGYARSAEELLRLATSRSDRPRRDLAILLQADFSDAPDDIPELVKRIESGADLALSDYRRRPGLSGSEALARRLLPLLVRPGGPNHGSQHVGTLKALRLVTLARVLSERGSRPLLERDGWAADAELLLAVARQARRVDVVPVTSAVLPRRRPSRSRPLLAVWAVWRVLRGARHGSEDRGPRPDGAAAGRGRHRGRGEARAPAPQSVPST